LEFVLNDLEHKKLFYDAKSVLQEEVQNHKLGILTYELLKEEGPEHDKSFFVAALLDGKKIGEGEGHNKKAAEQKAAYEAILAMRENRE
jgi:ribonuclease-3